MTLDSSAHGDLCRVENSLLRIGGRTEGSIEGPMTVVARPAVSQKTRSGLSLGIGDQYANMSQRNSNSRSLVAIRDPDISTRVNVPCGIKKKGGGEFPVVATSICQVNSNVKMSG